MNPKSWLLAIALAAVAALSSGCAYYEYADYGYPWHHHYYGSFHFHGFHHHGFYYCD